MFELKCKANGTCGMRLIVLISAVWIAVAGASNAQTAPEPVKPHRAHKPPAAHVDAAPPVQPEQSEPEQPEQPKWPVNDPPAQPSVTWNSQGLHVEATNSSLRAILNQISTETGAKIEGLNGDERVFGEYGPGQARDVLSQLLQGSAYNFLVLGNTDGALKVVLSGRNGGPPRPAAPDRNANRPMPQDNQPDDDQMQEPEPDQEPPQPMPQPIQQPPPPEQENPQGAITPQQRMQMMQQQRMQQMQQMQQQQQPPQ
jgi:hypothetical protein